MMERKGEEEFRGWEWANKPSGGKKAKLYSWLSVLRHILHDRSLKARSSKGGSEKGDLTKITGISNGSGGEEVERKRSGKGKRSSKLRIFRGSIKGLDALKGSLPSILAIAGIVSLLLALLPVTTPVMKKAVEPGTYELIPCVNGMLVKSDGDLCYDLRKISLHPAESPVRFPVIKGNGSLTVRLSYGNASETFEYELVDSGYVIPAADGRYSIAVEASDVHKIYDAVFKPVQGRLVDEGDGGIRVICPSGSRLIAGNPTERMAHILVYRRSYDILRFLVAFSLLASALLIKSRKKADTKD